MGTSPNAFQIQFWTALTALLRLKYLKLRSTFSWSLSNLGCLLRAQLFVYRPLAVDQFGPSTLHHYLNPDAEQIPLF